MANTYLTRTPSGAGNRKKFTISMWVKRVKLGVDQWLVQAGASGSEFDIRFTTADQVRFSTWDGSNGYGMITTRVFRDTSAWYHLVFQYDTAQATDTNRNKIYVNGEQISPSDTSAYNAGKHPPQNYDNPSWNNTTAFRINDVTWTSSSPKDAVYSHIHHTDGYAYPASTFGSTDSVTGEWSINTSPTITMGTNGFTILKDGNTITDQSTNSNNFTLGGGTLTKTEDCPSSVFATWNNLNGLFSAGLQSNGVQNGNTFIATTASNEDRSFGSTLALTGTGKYYMEFKVGNLGGGVSIGIGEVEAMQVLLNQTSSKYSNNAKGYAYLNSGNKEVGGSGASYGNSFTSLDYIGLAYNNGALWFSKNGTWQNSATISEISAGTTTNAAFTGIDTSKQYFIMFNGFNDAMIEMNAGNGYFRTTVIGSPNNPTSGDTGAKFKYTVPTGYQPLSTKGLNQ